MYINVRLSDIVYVPVKCVRIVIVAAQHQSVVEVTTVTILVYFIYIYL